MLGLGISLRTAIRKRVIGAGAEVFMWELDGSGHLKPLATGSGFDNDTWDLDGTDYMPAAVGAVAAEGNWDLDGNSDIQPLDV